MCNELHIIIMEVSHGEQICEKTQILDQSVQNRSSDRYWNYGCNYIVCKYTNVESSEKGKRTKSQIGRKAMEVNEARAKAKEAAEFLGGTEEEQKIVEDNLYEHFLTGKDVPSRYGQILYDPIDIGTDCCV